jgi:hypothetical protein
MKCFSLSHGLGAEEGHANVLHLLVKGVQTPQSALLFGWIILMKQERNEDAKAATDAFAAVCKRNGLDAKALPENVPAAVLAHLLDDDKDPAIMEGSGEREIDLAALTASYEVEVDDAGNTDSRHIFEVRAQKSEDDFKLKLAKKWVARKVSEVKV